ncbi:MAG: nucleotide sugar epimerase [Opitutaceae bacterium]|nr:nucleotide sugar epimerase [Opitutaceae bacterium]|tara:strand:+ start:1958 stop:2926 length:969 start_codon:yes stop_codon:yes gene_type:complete
MLILLTGCAGFVGWKTAELLAEQGHQVIGIDNVNDYYDVDMKRWRLNQLTPLKKFRFYEIDLEDRAVIEALFEEHAFNAVINLAARAGVRSSMENPHIYIQTNALGNLNLLDAMRQKGVKKFVLASTSSLYAGQEMPFLESLPVNEPISPYAASKKAAEAMAYTYHHLYGIDVSIVRYFTVYGPAGRPDMAPLRFVRWIDEGTPITLFGDGSQSRDFTYVDDIAHGTIAALKKIGFEIINLGGGKNPISISRMIETFETLLNKKAVIDEKPFIKADMLHTWAEISKAKTLLDWEPQVSFEKGMRNLVDWYLAEKEWVSQIQL